MFPVTMLALEKDIFEPSILPGLTFGKGLVSVAEEQALIAAIDQMQLPPFHFQGLLRKRRTASFGWRYDFDSESLHPAEPFPAFLLPVCERAARFAGLPTDALEHALLTRYDPGASIVWHCDRPAFDHVIGISLGASTKLQLRRSTVAGYDRTALPLPPRSIYHMTGEVRHQWEHRVPEIDATRWSITFRSLIKPINSISFPLPVRSKANA